MFLHFTDPSPGCFDNTSILGVSTIRHANCTLLLPQDGAVRCSACSTYRSTLTVQSRRMQRNVDTPTHTSHVNYRYYNYCNNCHTMASALVILYNICLLLTTIFRYQALPDLISRLGEVHHQYRIVSKQCDRLKKRIAATAEEIGVCLDEEAHDDMKALTAESATFLEDLPSDSFRCVFWQEQVEAASQKNAHTMRWHPLIIRWCLYLRHR